MSDVPDFLADLDRSLPLGRRLFSWSMMAIALLLTVIALLPLSAILYEILRQGLPQLNWQVLVSLPAPQGMEGVVNGFGNAIQGTLLMVAIASLISVPIGVMTGVFLSEFGKGDAISSSVRFVTLILSSVPSIVIGVFAYAVIVLVSKKFSALAGGFALSVIMLPVVALTTEEALKSVPKHYRLAAAALGGGQSQIFFRTILPAALSGITTGVLLAIARAAGETAPLIFTALSSQGWVEGLFDSTPSLSVLIYGYASSPFPEQNQLAWTAALVLLGLVLFSSLLSRLVTRNRLKNR